MKWSSAWVAVAFLTLAGGCASAFSQPPAIVPWDVEYEMYSVVLDNMFSEAAVDTFYVHEKTSPFRSGGAHETVPRTLLELPSVSSELIDAYIAANADTLQLDPARFQTQKPVVLTSSSGDLKVYLSRIGFSSDGSEAVIHYVVRCGTRGGWGYVMRLENIDGSWSIGDGLRTMMF